MLQDGRGEHWHPAGKTPAFPGIFAAIRIELVAARQTNCSRTVTRRMSFISV